MRTWLTYTDENGVERGMTDRFALDLAYGADENDFALTVPIGFRLEYGSLVYVDETEWGGVIDRKRPDTTGDAPVTVYSGRTWHGILAGSVVTGFEYDGDANGLISALLSRHGLDYVFSTPPDASGIRVSATIDCCDLYTGIRSALAEHGAKLRVVKPAGQRPILSAVAIGDYVDGIDSDRYAFRAEHAHRKPNHLVCIGEDDEGNRIEAHLYADGNGNVSQVQTYFGIDEIARLYHTGQKDRESLIERGTEELLEMQDADWCEMSLPESGEYEVGDKVGVTSAETGMGITAHVVKVIAKVSHDGTTVSYEIGEAEGWLDEMPDDQPVFDGGYIVPIEPSGDDSAVLGAAILGRMILGRS